ncbi:MAG: hypothetical protein DKINENOH_00527 [bacterium]|nr:hypothetical protein [bacterium]
MAVAAGLMYEAASERLQTALKIEQMNYAEIEPEGSSERSRMRFALRACEGRDAVKIWAQCTVFRKARLMGIAKKHCHKLRGPTTKFPLPPSSLV